MIPDISEIIAGLIAGKYSAAQANGWLATHMELAAMREDGPLEYPPLGLAADDENSVAWDFPILHFGYGALEVGDATWQGLNALFIGTDGQGLGVERERNEPAKDGETLVLMTFKNLEGLEAFEYAVKRVRQKMEAKAA